MIVSCPECNGKVSDTVPSCPHCGFQLKPITKSGPVLSGQQTPVERIPCPYCGEAIMPTATVCPFCKGAVIGGKPVPHQQAQHPMVIVQQQQQQSQPAVVVPPRGFVGSAIITFFLYLLCWPLGLITNILWYNEASRLEKATGISPEGKGCLQIMLAIGVVLLIILFAAIILPAMNTAR